MNLTDNSGMLLLRRLLIFIIITLICLTLGALVIGMITSGGSTTPRLRVATVIQDLVMFLIPAVVTACICSRYPASFLWIDKKPRVTSACLAVLTLLVSAPLQNVIVKWNEQVKFPSELEQWLKSAEESSQHMVNTLMGGTTVGDLILGILIVGILAALSEELFFRGALLRILSGNQSSMHVAIWTTAVVFSAFHLQFYGFVPRMLLGAYFGYLVWWTRSLWIPVIVHAVNNSLVVSTEWHARLDNAPNSITELGTDSPLMVIASVALTIAGIVMLHRRRPAH